MSSPLFSTLVHLHNVLYCASPRSLVLRTTWYLGSRAGGGLGPPKADGLAHKRAPPALVGASARSRVHVLRSSRGPAPVFSVSTISFVGLPCFYPTFFFFSRNSSPPFSGPKLRIAGGQECARCSGWSIACCHRFSLCPLVRDRFWYSTAQRLLNSCFVCCGTSFTSIPGFSNEVRHLDFSSGASSARAPAVLFQLSALGCVRLYPCRDRTVQEPVSLYIFRYG